MRSRPVNAPDGPPGLAALLDAERSVLREHHERLRTLADAERAAELRAIALDDAIKLQHDARRQSRGMRDRMRAREMDRRLLTADARSVASAAQSAAEAARLRVLATERRLSEIRGLVDSQSGGARPEIEALRRTAVLPSTAQLFSTIAEFIRDRPHRAAGDPRQQDLIGQPLGDRWLLEEAGRPWAVTQWRASWNTSAGACSGELYAVEHSVRPRNDRRVWLLGAAPPGGEAAARVEAALGRQHERNSLAALAGIVSTG